MTYTAMDACLRAQQVWELVGKPGEQYQLELFARHSHAPPEVVKGLRADRPRKRKRRR